MTMKKRLNIVSFFILLVLSSCQEMSTEIVGVETTSEPEIGVIGYVSNRGVVAHVQKTQPPVSDNDAEKAIDDVSAGLYNQDDELLTTLQKHDALNYLSPDGFKPQYGEAYYLKISAPGFETITTGMQELLDLPGISKIEMEIESPNYLVEDSALYNLFGNPRRIKVDYYIDNSNNEITNYDDRRLYHYKGELYNYDQIKRKYTRFYEPLFFVNIGMGASAFLEEKPMISGFIRVKDHIYTDETISYEGETYQVIDRIDSLIIQTIHYSDDFVTFFDAVDDYMEKRYEPVSMVAEKMPSNVSNGVGFFGSVYISQREVAIPDVKEGYFEYEY
jgi:hypothetical protein